MKVLFATRTIEVTKKFSKKAAIFGAEEYQLMREVLKDFSDFEVVVKATPVRRQTYMKGLTYDYMASHIARIDTDGSIMRDFEILEICRTGIVSLQRGGTTIRRVTNL